MNSLNKTESAIFASLICSLLPKDLHSELILHSMTKLVFGINIFFSYNSTVQHIYVVNILS